MIKHLNLTPWVCLFSLLFTGCVQHQVISNESTPAIKAQVDIPESERLDVGIILFDANVPEDIRDQRDANIYPKVREAEAKYLAYTLKHTLEGTGLWGVVRVLPNASRETDVQVFGKIIESDGEVLLLNVRAVDVSGAQWFEKQYQDASGKYSFDPIRVAKEDPFQDLYNQIADDLWHARNKLSKEALVSLRHLTYLKFARSMAPYAFDEYISEEDGKRATVLRLPADSDPMHQRISKVRKRDDAVVDTLDQYYGKFHAEMGGYYNDWRRFSREEALLYKDTVKKAKMHKILGAAAVIGGIIVASEADGDRGLELAGQMGALSGISLYRTGSEMQRSASIHADALSELSESFNAEIEPLETEAEGQVVTLEGNVEQQFESWRTQLKAIYAKETGVSVETVDGLKAESGAP